MAAERDAKVTASYQGPWRLSTRLGASDLAIPALPHLLRRSAAGLIDWVVLFCVDVGVGDQYWALETLYGRRGATPYVCLFVGIAFAYFAITESCWRASVGKMICGLRVVGLDPSSAFGLRLLGRTALYAVLPGFVQLGISDFLVYFGVPSRPLERGFFLFEPFLPLALFVTARRKNGWTAAHDLSTGTRVVAKLEPDTRLRLEMLPSASGQEAAQASPDAVPGKPLTDFLPAPSQWSIVRYWISDLADELATVSADQPLPDVLSLDCIWITTDGHARLMDFDRQRPKADLLTGNELPGNGLHASRTFLAQVAMSALEGRVALANEATSRPIRALLPLDARTLMDRLPECADLRQFAADFKPLLSRPATISRSRRLTLAAVCGFFPFALAILVANGYLTDGDSNFQYLDVEMQRRALERLEVLANSADTTTAGEQRQLELRISFLDRRGPRTDAYSEAFLTRAQQERREQVRSHQFDSEAARNANALYPSFGGTFAVDGMGQRFASPFLPRIFLLMLMLMYWMLIILSVLSAILFRGLASRALGVIIVNGRGLRASRWRVLVRTLAAWSPLLAIAFIQPFPDNPRLLALLLITFFGGAAYSIFTPTRSLQDWIARTWLVPR